MATFMTRAAETEVLRGDEIGHDRSTPEGERFYSLRRSLMWGGDQRHRVREHGERTPVVGKGRARFTTEQ
jgi:hypothetical protein